MKARCLILGMMIVGAAVADANQPLAIKVSPVVSFAPSNLSIRTSVEPNADNRSMEVLAESDDFYRSSAVMLDGERAPKTTQFEFAGLPSGEYEVSVVLTGADGQQRAISHAQVKVIASSAAR